MKNEIIKNMLLVESLSNKLAIKLPLIKIKTNLYHVGTMDKSKRKKFSHEGRGLSVSTVPNDWRIINRGMTTGDTYLLVKKTNIFVDVHAIDNNTWELLYNRGVDNGYLKQQTTYSYTYYDDDLDEEMHKTFNSEGEVLEELLSMGQYETLDDAIENEAIEINKGGYVATDKLITINEGNNDIKLIVSVYAIEETNVDGLFWFDELDVGKYSAPRGVIFDHMLSGWEIEKQDDTNL
jgi:TM2 domain-containing membrane protein YozV